MAGNMFSSLGSIMGRDMAVDLGTANTLVYVRGEGIVLNEPSVVAVNVKDGRPVAVGAEAKRMIGRTPAHIQAIRPLKDGVIADFDICEKMLRYFIQKVHTSKWSKPRMVICVPSGITPVEQRAVQEAAEFAGARKPAYIIEEPMAAAIGAGLPVQEPTGNMIVDIGGGTTEVAVISLGGVVTSQSARVGGDELDHAIIHFIKKEYSLALGERTAEEVKMALGSAWPLETELHAEIRGRDLVTGLPKTIVTTTEEIREAIDEPVAAIVDAVKVTLDKTPPELAADIMETGHRPRRWWRAAQRPRRPSRARDRHAHRDRPEPAVRGGDRLGPVPRGVRRPEGRAVLVHDQLGPGSGGSGPQHPAQRAHPVHVLLLVLTAITLLTLDGRGFGPIDSARSAVLSALAPVGDFGAAVFRPIGNAWDSAFQQGDLEAENQRLQEENERLQGEVTAGQISQEQLRQLLENEGITFAGRLPAGARQGRRRLGRQLRPDPRPRQGVELPASPSTWRWSPARASSARSCR